MKAITLCQPYAAWVAEGLKDETRTWTTKHRGPLAIHVSQRVDHEAMGTIGGPYHAARMLNERGKIICVANLVDVRPMRPEDEGRAKIGWSDRRHLWILRDVFRVPPLPWKGSLGLWWVPDEAVANVLRSPPDALLGLAP